MKKKAIKKTAQKAATFQIKGSLSDVLLVSAKKEPKNPITFTSAK